MYHGMRPISALLTDCPPFRSLDELVKDKVNGLVFHTAQELAVQLEVCLLSPRLSACVSRLKASSLQTMLRGFPVAPELAAPRRSFQSSAPDPSAPRNRAAHSAILNLPVARRKQAQYDYHSVRSELLGNGNPDHKPPY